MKIKAIMYPLAAAGLIAAAAACTSTSSSTATGSVPAGIASSASALASVPGADAQAMLIKAGVPIGGTPAQQIAFGKSMLTRANRHALAQRLGIPPQNRAAFEAAVLGAIEHGHLSAHARRVAFFDVTLPGLVRQYQA